MITRRIVACACALALAVPAVASARPGFDAPVPATSHVAYGDTKYDLQNAQDLGSPTLKGDTKNDVAPVISKRHVAVPAGKSAGALVALNQQHHAPAAASSSNDVDGWRLAALLEAGVLAAVAFAAAAAVTRTRPRHGAMA